MATLKPPISGNDFLHSCFSVHVISQGKAWTVRRTFREFIFLDKQVHTCVFDRAFSKLPHLAADNIDFEQENFGPNADNGQKGEVGQS